MGSETRVHTRVLAKHFADRGCPAGHRMNCQANAHYVRYSVCNATEVRRVYCATVSNAGSAARERTPLVPGRPLQETDVEGLASNALDPLCLLQATSGNPRLKADRFPATLHTSGQPQHHVGEQIVDVDEVVHHPGHFQHHKPVQRRPEFQRRRKGLL